VYAHLPTVLNEQGEKMSKRHGAKAVTQYRDEGYLADAIVNYLARLGWSHGDDEIFSRQQLVEWFNLDHLGKSAGQFDEAKLRWVAQQHMKTADDAMLAGLVREQFARHGVALPESLQAGDRLTALCALFKDRCATTIELMEWLTMYVQHLHAPAEELAAQLTDVTRPAVLALAKHLESVAWEKDAISQAIKDTLKEVGLKMPQLAIPVRLLVCGRAQTPSVDAVLALFDRNEVLARLAHAAV
jgi:glutamyl-tRNA synthetase